MKNPINSDKIYTNSEYEVLPEYYDKDFVKILYKNPLEAYCFWEISKQTFMKAIEVLHTEVDRVHTKLLVKYNRDIKNRQEYGIDLPPFTNNWFLKFDVPPRQLKIEVAVFAPNGSYYVLLHSAIMNMPPEHPSLEVDPEWICEKWVVEGWLENKYGPWMIRNSEDSERGNAKQRPIGSSEIFIGSSSGQYA